MNNSLQAGGVYVVLFLNATPGDCHWGLYLHYETTVVTDRRGFPRTIHSGHKYHVKNMSGGWIADHNRTGGVLSSLFLVGLLCIGILPYAQQGAFDSISRCLDQELNSRAAGSSTFCRTWTMSIVRRLIYGQCLRTNGNYTDNGFFSEVEMFGRDQWQAAHDAELPRPIQRSSLFMF